MMALYKTWSPARRRLFGIGMLLLAFGLAFFALTCRAHAQESPAAHAAAQAGNRTAEPASQNAEQVEKPDAKDEFRLSTSLPISPASIAAKLHMSPRLFAAICDWLNFGVLAIAIWIGLRKIMPSFFRKRDESIQGSLKEAREATLDARHRLDVVEQRLSRLDEEIISLRHAAERDLNAEEERFRRTLDEERQRIVDSAEEEIAAAAAAQRRELKAFAAELAVSQAERNLRLTPEMDRTLTTEFATHLGRNGSNN